MENENEDFRTSDINLASFLCAKDFRLLKIENHSRRKFFVFSDSPQLKHLIEVFNFGEEGDSEAVIDARKVFRAFKELKAKLYSTNYH